MTQKVRNYDSRIPNTPVGQQSPWQSIKEKPSISGDTGSNKALCWAVERFQACRKDHYECSKSDVPLPTRVLEVGLVDSGEEVPKVKLYVTQGEIAPYICLSHCWGLMPNKAKTMQSTLKEYQGGISWMVLPKTFQEAVLVTLRLGVHYLWIDSLCIIQDDKDDWRRESSEMCSVYSGGALTIFATDSTDSQGGLFRKPSPFDLSLKVMDGITDGCQWEINVAPDLKNIQKFLYYPKAFPLFSRAWVYQERLLSSRQLHFGASEIEWKCEAGIAGEGSTICSSKDVDDIPLGLSAQSISKLADRWHELVERYSSLDLSFSSDRLPAVGGVAKQMEGFMKCEYLAGLWGKSLLGDLLWWKAPPYHHRIKRPPAPTWSWASVDGPVVYMWDARLAVPLCEILECCCSTLSPDSFGQVSAGHLTVSGMVSQVDHSSRRRVRTEQSRNAGESEFDFLVALRSKGTNRVDPDYPWYEEGYARIQPKESVFLLKLGKSDKRLYSVVLRCTDPSTQTYERVGLLMQDSHVMETDVEFFPRERVREETIHIV